MWACSEKRNRPRKGPHPRKRSHIYLLSVYVYLSITCYVVVVRLRSCTRPRPRAGLLAGRVDPVLYVRRSIYRNMWKRAVFLSGNDLTPPDRSRSRPIMDTRTDPGPILYPVPVPIWAGLTLPIVIILGIIKNRRSRCNCKAGADPVVFVHLSESLG